MPLLDAGGLASVDGRTRWVLVVTGDDTDRDWPAGRFAADQSARRAENFSLTAVDPTLAHPFVLAAGERALPRPDHVVAWRGTGDPEPVRKAQLGGRLPVVAAVSG